MAPTSTAPLSRFLTFDREAWARLRANTPLTLTESDLDALRTRRVIDWRSSP